MRTRPKQLYNDNGDEKQCFAAPSTSAEPLHSHQTAGKPYVRHSVVNGMEPTGSALLSLLFTIHLVQM